MSNDDKQQLREIFERARKLPPVDRADLLEQIFETFDSSGQFEIDQQWASESEERLKAYRSGDLKSEPADQVMRRINNRTDS